MAPYQTEIGLSGGLARPVTHKQHYDSVLPIGTPKLKLKYIFYEPGVQLWTPTDLYGNAKCKHIIFTTYFEHYNFW